MTGSSDKTIRQWDVNTGQCVLTMDILWAISNAPSAPSQSSGSYDSYPLHSADNVLPGSNLLAAVTSGAFAVPTPPYSDGSWDMYQDFVGGVQFWGYALASASGDGGVRMWDSAFPSLFFLSCVVDLYLGLCLFFTFSFSLSENRSGPSNPFRTHRSGDVSSV